jgi:hypothetical protein
VGVTRLKFATSRPENCRLDIYSSTEEVQRPGEAVRMIDSKTSSKWFADKTVAQPIENAKPDACACGADALVVLSAKADGPGGLRPFSWGSGFSLLRAIRCTK